MHFFWFLKEQNVLEGDLHCEQGCIIVANTVPSKFCPNIFIKGRKEYLCSDITNNTGFLNYPYGRLIANIHMIKTKQKLVIDIALRIA